MIDTFRQWLFKVHCRVPMSQWSTLESGRKFCPRCGDTAAVIYPIEILALIILMIWVL